MMPIDDVFEINRNLGTSLSGADIEVIVTGKVSKGIITAGGNVELIDSNFETILNIRASKLEQFHKEADKVEEGDTACIVLEGIRKKDIIKDAVAVCIR